MVATKKTRARKKYQHNVDKKKANKKARKLPNINCKPIKKAWKNQMSVSKNLQEMGLAYDPNKEQPIIHHEVPIREKKHSENMSKASTSTVVKQLEEETQVPRDGTMRIPKEKIKWIEYCLDKHGDDYEAMARDKNNHYQDTAAQIRQKIKQFKKRPAYWIPYLKSRGLLNSEDKPQEETES